jgi:DNA (cytosine-5)-methyltransferase 1
MNGQPLRYLSLFSGIGGFDLGFDRAGMVCAGQVEFDEKARAVLAKHWPDVPRLNDVTGGKR